MKQQVIEKIDTIPKALVVANICVWVYFWIAFALAAEPYDAAPWGHPPIDVYSFWGYAIGLTHSAFMYPFMKVVAWVEFPSFAIATLGQKVLKISTDRFLLGISANGYRLLATMLLSFAQWFLLGKVMQRLFKRRPSSVGPNAI